MRFFIRAAKFIIQSQLKEFPEIAKAEIELIAGKDRLPALLYRRVGIRNDRFRGTILAVSGMSVHGYRDIRFDTICRAMAARGFIVNSLGGAVKTSRNSRSTTAPLDDRTASRSIAGNPVLSPDGRFSPSPPRFFGRHVHQRRINVPRHGRTIGAICSVGTFGSVETASNSLFARQTRRVRQDDRIEELPAPLHRPESRAGKGPSIFS